VTSGIALSSCHFMAFPNQADPIMSGRTHVLLAAVTLLPVP
jgi:hypothetical protein